MQISCKEFEDVVHGLVRMELLDVNVRESALEHAAHCEHCSQRMAEATALAEDSEMMAERTLEEQTPPHVEAALLAAFRGHHRRASWRRTLEWAGVGAAAVVLLGFLWMAAGGSKSPSSPAQKKDGASQSGVPLDAKEQGVSKPDVEVRNATPIRVQTPVNETYSASDFVPVPFTGAITADDPGMVVRVQLTRASLAQLGYPVAETPDEDLISADVLVGEDGWPRGVKLIQ